MNTRHKSFFIIIALIIIAIIVRLGYLQLYKTEFFKTKSNNQLKRIIKLFPNRGSIFDRNLKPLALTETSYQIYAIPHEIENKWILAKKIASILDSDRKELSDKLYASKAPFLWLKRHIYEKPASHFFLFLVMLFEEYWIEAYQKLENLKYVFLL